MCIYVCNAIHNDVKEEYIMSKRTEAITCTVMAETPDAVRLNDGFVNEWVPRSQIIDIEPDGADGLVIVEMYEWIAIEKGFI